MLPNLDENASYGRKSTTDTISPIVLSVVSEIILQVLVKDIPDPKLLTLIGSVAEHFGADIGLIGCLMRVLPQLYKDTIVLFPASRPVLLQLLPPTYVS